MDLDKKKIDDEGQPVTVKTFLMWNVLDFGLLQLKSFKKNTPFRANQAKRVSHFRPDWPEAALIKSVWSFETNTHLPSPRVLTL